MKEPQEYLHELIEVPIDNLFKTLDNLDKEIETTKQSMPDTLQTFRDYLTSLSNLRSKIESIQFTVSTNQLSQYVSLTMKDEWNKQYIVYADAMEDLVSRVNETIDLLQQINASHNRSIYSEVDVENSVFTSLKEKHDMLMGYSTLVTDMCTRYGVSASDLTIDETTIEPHELERLYDEYIDYLKKNKTAVNPVTKLKEKVSDVRYQAAVIGIIVLLACTPLLSIISIVGLVGCIYAIKVQNKKAVYLSVLQALLYNINPDRIIHAEVDQSLLLPETVTVDDVDTYPELKELDEESDRLELELHPDNTIGKEHAEYNIKFSQVIPQSNQIVSEATNKFTAKKNMLLNSVNGLIKQAEEKYEKLKSEYKGFGDRFSEVGVFNTNLTLGENNFIEEYVNVGHHNIIIRPNNNEQLMDSFIRCLFVNAITNVLYVKMHVWVLDPNNMGNTVMPFYRPDLENQITIVQEKIGDILKEMAVTAKKNFELMQGLTIEEYNTKSIESKRDTIPYNLLLILSQPKELETTEELNSLFQYSANAGILIWVVSDNMVATEDTFVFNQPFEGVRHPIRKQDDQEWCRQVSKKYSEAINNYRPPSLSWRKFINILCPPEKQWKELPDDDIFMFPGLQNGDPDLAIGFPLGNGGNVHFLGAGTTGAGKSVFLNNLIMTTCTYYSPTEVELWLADFKGTEFKFFMPSELRPFVLPHLKACLCTSDGAYAQSLFHAVAEISANRFEQMKLPNEHRDWLEYDDGETIPNFDNSKNWNKYWEDRAKVTGDQRYMLNRFRRLLLICDEFQQIFSVADNKVIDAIKSDMDQVARLGRAAAVHMGFFSQGLNGTLDKSTIAQFSLRFALRCTGEVSQDLLGTMNAAVNMPKFGQLYVTATGIPKESQPRFTSPGIDKEKDVVPQTKELAERAKAIGFKPHDLITYEEATKHPIEEIQSLYDKLHKEDKMPKQGSLFILGERMAYSTNKMPDNFIIGKKNNENIISCFSDYTDYVYFFNTFLCNLKNNEESSLIINSQVEDLDYLVDAETHITNPDAFKKLIRYNVKDMVKWMQGLFNSKKEQENPKTTWIVLLGWDKGTGYGVDPDMNIRSQLNSFLQQCGTSNIHVLMVTLGMTGVPASTVAACKYRIAGKCTVDDSSALIETRQAGLNYEMKTGWMFVKNNGIITRDKLYISEVTKQVASSELVM